MIIEREECSGFSESYECKKCAKQFTCEKTSCTGLVKFSDTKNFGEVERKK